MYLPCIIITIVGVWIVPEAQGDPKKGTDLYDVSCHPEYKKNEKADEEFDAYMKRACEFRKNSNTQCYKDCILQGSRILQVDHLDWKMHAKHLSQWMPDKAAIKLAKKVMNNCNDKFELATKEENGGHTCMDEKNPEWSAFFECVENIWKCKA